MLDITLLGTAALMPIPDRALTAATLTCAGHTILFDCGEGTQTAARRAGVSLMKADVIALTHYHGDHIFGLPGLLQTMEVFGRTQPLTLVGPAGLEAAMRPILELAGHTGYPVRLATLPEDGLKLEMLARGWPEGARLAAFPTVHRVPSQGYCFTLDRAGKFLPDRARALGVPVNQWSLLQRGQRLKLEDGRAVGPEDVLGAPRRGLKFVFTGDTAPCDSLVEAAKGADLMICEATYGEDDQAQLAQEHGHMVFAQAAGVAHRAGVRRLWLAHYSQMVEDPSAYLPNATALFEHTVCGADGLSVTLRFEEQAQGPRPLCAAEATEQRGEMEQ